MENIYTGCYKCGGHGIIIRYVTVGDDTELEEVECDVCSGMGQRVSACVYNETNIFHSYEILEELDATEHNALTAAQKDGILIILACGLVDLNEGKVGRVRLWNWFGAESTTVANLTALLT